jgi:hypothetical protein
MKVTRLVRAGVVTGIVDGLFSGLLSEFAYGSTAVRLFQGVAATLLGPAALEGGAATAGVGVLMHFGVAFGWSAVFLVLVTRAAAVRRLVASPRGKLGVAAIYGPFIWMTMSLAVIPLLTGRPPAITARWWIQFFGHIPFVALPIVALIGAGDAISEMACLPCSTFRRGARRP